MSRPSLVIVEDDDWGEFSALPSSRSARSVPTSTSSSSGELNVYTNVGTVISAEVSKREVWFLDESKQPCLGKVGNNNKFCVKACMDGKNHCGTGRHSAKFEVEADHAFIKITDNQVFKVPSLDLRVLSDSQCAKLLSLVQLPTEWENDFKKIVEGEMVEWMEDDEDSTVTLDQGNNPSVELLSPGTSKFKTGIFDIMPTFSFDSSSSDDVDHMNGNEFKIADHRIQKMEMQLEGLKSKLTRPFMDIETSYTMLITDLSNLHARDKQLCAQMGTPKPNFKETTVYGSLHQLWMRGNLLDEARTKAEHQWTRLVTSQENLQGQMDCFSEDLAELQGVTLQLESWHTTVNKAIEMFNKRFGIIKPLLAKLTDNKENFSDGSNVAQRVNVTSNPGIEPDSVLYRRILDLEEKIKILENRVAGSGVQLGGYVFQSFDDLLVWVKVKVPKGRFGLFVDGHSFLEFFSLSGHINTEAGTAAFSNSQKAGFSTYVEAQLAISFKNLFPHAQHE